MTSNNGLFYLFSDHLGSTSVLATSNGVEVPGSRARYYPFGNPRTAPTQTITGRNFTGQKENMELGLIYYNARYYVPGSGRFLTPDTLIPDPAGPQQFNRYTYTLNNPLRFTDPSGHISCDELGTEECTNNGEFVNTPPLPSTSYVYVQYSENGTYFDKNHVIASKTLAEIIIQNVTTLSLRGGGTFNLGGDLRNVVSFEATYWVSGGLTNDEIIGVSLGIFMAYQIEWEKWEGEVLWGSVEQVRASAFAIEDLPSDYIVFFLAVNPNYTASMVLNMLGSVEPSGKPPRVVCSGGICTDDRKNYSFDPKISINGTWVNVPWPEQFQIEPIFNPYLWQQINTQSCWGGC